MKIEKLPYQGDYFGGYDYAHLTKRGDDPVWRQQEAAELEDPEELENTELQYEEETYEPLDFG